MQGLEDYQFYLCLFLGKSMRKSSIFLGENCWGVEWTKIRRFKSQIFKFLLSLGHWANGYKMSDQYGNGSSLTFQQKKQQMVEFPAASYDGNLRLHVCLPNMIPTQTWFERIMEYKWPILQLRAKCESQKETTVGNVTVLCVFLRLDGLEVRIGLLLSTCPSSTSCWTCGKKNQVPWHLTWDHIIQWFVKQKKDFLEILSESNHSWCSTFSFLGSVL